MCNLYSSFTAVDEEKLSAAREKFEFQAEVSRLMDIIINSLYTKVDIFLRELISNASDALDKIRFESLSNPSALGEAGLDGLSIYITGDSDAHTLTLRDSGIGMTKQDLINYLGTVARSGTASLMEQLASGGDLNLIGQFGVGFYSVYLVADKVRVVTKHNDDNQYVWESAADGTFTIAEDPRGNTLGRGTEITLFLKDDAVKYAETETLKELIKRYSEFITFPIYLQESKEIEVEVELTPEEIAERDAASEEEEEDEIVAFDEEEEKPTTRTEKRIEKSWELINDTKAIWSRSTSEITDEEYTNFFNSLSKDTEGPITWNHFRGEGEVEFQSILYVPNKVPFDLYDNYYTRNAELKLYVRKVLISDEFTELLPRYLNFVKGVVDSDDLPLNVSREQLQQTRILKVIGKKLVRKALEMISNLAKAQKAALEASNEGEKEDENAQIDEDDDSRGTIPSHLKENASTVYDTFWSKFGKNIKLGVLEDHSNKSRLAKLLRFKTTFTEEEPTEGETVPAWRSLEDYIESMKDGQKQIYFLAGESVEELIKSPFLKRFKENNLEVILMVDPLDEYVVQNLPEFDGKRLQAITKEGLQLPVEDEDVEKKRTKLYTENFKPLVSYLKKVYGEKVEKVVISNRLTDTPCVLVTGQYGYSANMERIMRAQAFSDAQKHSFMFSKKTMEINPRHPVIAELNKKVSENPETDDEATRDLAFILFDNALLQSGFHIADVDDFSSRMLRLMQGSLELPSLELLPVLEVPPEEEEEEDEEDGEEYEEIEDEDYEEFSEL